MKSTAKIQRRELLALGGTLLTGAIASKAHASTQKICSGISTPKQDDGPFFPHENTAPYPINENPSAGFPMAESNDSDLTKIKGKNGTAKGQAVIIKGQLTNSLCEPIKVANIIIWQASESGLYNHIHDSINEDFEHPKTGQIVERKHDDQFQYWGKATTGSDGQYQFKTIIPGFYPANLDTKWFRPPHIHFMVNAMGHPSFITQMYFDCPTLDENVFFMIRMKPLFQKKGTFCSKELLIFNCHKILVLLQLFVRLRSRIQWK